MDLYNPITGFTGSWKSYYDLFEDRQLPVTEWHHVIRSGGQLARAVANKMSEAPFLRRSEIERIEKKVNRISKTIQSSDRELGKAKSLWHMGYFYYWAYQFRKARECYSQAYRDLNQSPNFLMDYGRLEYNTGRLIEAEQLFERAFEYRDSLDFQPLQVYRWLAKVYRLSGKFEAEVAILENLNGVINRNGGPQTESFNEGNAAKSREFVIDHLGRAYIDTGKFLEAFAFLKESLEAGKDNASKLAKQGVIALVGMKREMEAASWANEWSEKLNDRTILIPYLQLTRRSFSASTAKIEDILIQMAETDVEEEAHFMYRSPYSSAVEIINRPRQMWVLQNATSEAFKEGFIDEGLEILFQAAKEGFAQSDSLYIAALLSILKSNYQLLPRVSKIDALFEEAEREFPDCSYVLVQCGHRHMYRGMYEKAYAAYAAANLSDIRKDKGLRAFLAVGYGGLGQHDTAQRIFEEVLKQTKGEDVFGDYREALNWAIVSHRYPVALKWAEKFMTYATLGEGTEQDARIVYEYAGRAALALGRYDLASKYYEYLVVQLAHWFSETRNDSLEFTLPTHAQANLLWALTASLADDIETGEARLRQARVLDEGNTLLPVVEAVIAVKKKLYHEAVNLLLEAKAEDWLMSSVGRYIVHQVEQAGITGEKTQRLRYLVDKASGQVPEPFELIQKLEEQNHSLQNLRDYAEETHRTYTSLKCAFQTMLNSLPLAEVEQAERDKLIDRIQSSSIDLNEAVEKFVEVLVHRSRKAPTQTNRYKLILRDEVWSRLGLRIKERFEVAHSYVLATEQSEYDLGPAVLALSSALEHLLKEMLIKPLYTSIKMQKSALLQDSPVKFKTATLGQVSFLLGAHGTVSKDYQKFVHGWVSKKFPEKADYILKVLPERTDLTSRIRNDWAHGGPSITLEEFREFETFLFDEKGIFVNLG